MIRNGRNDLIVARTIETAFDSPTRNKGLLGRSHLAADAALILAPCQSIHTFFMRFAIDVAFVDRTGTILRLRHDVRPWRVQVSPRAFAVVEMAAGCLARSNNQLGDRLFLAPG